MFWERQVTTATVTEALGWGIGIGLAVTDVFTEVDVGDIGVLIAGASAVLQVKRAIVAQHEREDAAFRFGTRSQDVKAMHDE